MTQQGFPEPISKLINLLSRLPGIGEKNATRLSIHILKSTPEYCENLSKAIKNVKSEVKLCTSCFCLSADTVCTICSNTDRNHEILCVVEDPVDLISIEKSNEYDGVYHVLHGVISPIDGIGPDDLRIKELIQKLSNNGVKEVILATNPSVEGEATALYLSNLIKPFGIRTSRIAHGIPMGGDIEYIDELTLGKAIKDRKDF